MPQWRLTCQSRRRLRPRGTASLRLVWPLSGRQLWRLLVQRNNERRGRDLGSRRDGFDRWLRAGLQLAGRQLAACVVETRERRQERVQDAGSLPVGHQRIQPWLQMAQLGRGVARL